MIETRVSRASSRAADAFSPLLRAPMITMKFSSDAMNDKSYTRIFVSIVLEASSGRRMPRNFTSKSADGPIADNDNE